MEYFTNYNKTRVQQLAKELGIELPKFDHLEWNKLALEISRKEREIGAKDPTEVDPRRRIDTP